MTKNLAEQARRRETAANVAALAVANALIFQEQLAAAESKVKPIRKLLEHTDFSGALADHWQFICDNINYVPIFHIAREILLELPAGSDDDLRGLAKYALRITSRKAALRHDLMGRIYHLLLHDAKYLGTYYTSVGAATLLLKLALASERWWFDWADLDSLRNFKIADLACGTGTLLMAASQAVTDNFVRSCAAKGLKVNTPMLRELHRAIMEDITHGYDVTLTAAHLTASTLALLAPEIGFKKMQLYSLPLGKEDSEIRLGSIDFLASSSIEVQLDLMGEWAKKKQAQVVTGAGTKKSEAPIPMLDLCVMNPPFVRSVGGNLLFGSLPRDRSAMQTELKKRMKSGGGKDALGGTTDVLANVTAGLGSVFVAVADPHIKRGGRIALVLPAALTTGPAWKKTRRLLTERYFIEYVVTSHDAERWAFSENTDLSEVLVIARKRLAEEQPEARSTVFVNLSLNPRIAADALGVADAVLKAVPAHIGSVAKPEHGVAPLLVGNSKYGEAVLIPTSELAGDEWLAGCFAQTELVRLIWLLRRGSLLEPGATAVTSIPIKALGDLAVLGPDRRDIYDGFNISKTKTAYPALWGHDAEKVTSIALDPNAWLSPLAKAKKGRPLRDPALLWSRSGRIMIAERLWLVTQRVTAVRLPEPALGNVWWPVRLKLEDERHDKALALWFNSTLGILMSIAHRVPTRGPWVSFKKPLLERLPVVDVTALTNDALDTIAKTFDEVAGKTLEPIPSLAHDATRRQIDEAFMKVLGLPDVKIIAELFAREPVVANARIASTGSEAGSAIAAQPTSTVSEPSPEAV
jgi:hypothetical protein